MILALLAGAAAADDVWSVSDPALEAPLRDALDAAWPERAVDVEVRIGDAGNAALGWDGATVTVRDGARVRRAPADDAAVVVLLARTWAVAAPAGAEVVYVPALPAPPPTIPTPPPLPEATPRWRWRAGLGMRTLLGPNVEAARVVGQVAPARGRVAVEAALLAAPAPALSLPQTDGAVRDLWSDRAALGLSAVVVPLRVGPVGLRLAAGPEVRWTEHWLYVEGHRSTVTGWSRVAGIAGAGLVTTLGRWEVVAAGLGRVSAGDEPVAEGGVEVDVRYRLRR